MANKQIDIGERYNWLTRLASVTSAHKCSAEFIVTKGGKGNLGCCGQPMQLK